MEQLEDHDLARLAISVLDLTDLGEDTDADAADDLCDRALAAGVAAVCVWPAYVALCAERLAGTDIKVATVVNFPSGEEPRLDVIDMTSRALVDGADEIDAVLPYHAWLHGDDAAAAAVLDGVREAINERSDLSHGDGLLKIIIETGALPDRAAMDRATHFAIAHGADFVKTSTGKIEVSATPEAAEVVLEAIEVSGMPVGFKASGGVRNLGDARLYIELAERIMGPGWVSPDTFRFGASGLLDALLAVTGDLR
jgi:deoxyribose-phosphate aldolase